jgi:hypothetical protein
LISPDQARLSFGYPLNSTAFREGTVLAEGSKNGPLQAKGPELGHSHPQ